MDYRIISIGALAANPLWNEGRAVRVGHCTTTLVTAGKRRILVDPGLPTQVIVSRLNERAGLKPSDITDVFLTSFLPDTRRGITAFESARWLISERERETIGMHLAQRFKELAASGGGKTAEEVALREALEQDIAILRRCEAAPDKIEERVDLFPLPGVTPGLTGILLEGARFTTLICGDAIASGEHLDQGKILPQAVSVEQAKESFEEAVEIADMLIPGRDNTVVNPTKRPF